MSPDLPPPVADVVEPLAATGNIANVDVLEDREAQDVLEQLGRQVGQFLREGLVGNPVYSGVPLFRRRRRHFYCLPDYLMSKPRPLMAQGGRASRRVSDVRGVVIGRWVRRAGDTVLHSCVSNFSELRVIPEIPTSTTMFFLSKKACQMGFDLKLSFPFYPDWSLA